MGIFDALGRGKISSVANGDLEAFALLRTPHGNGISGLLIDDQEVPGKKGDIRITCYTGRGKEIPNTFYPFEVLATIQSCLRCVCYRELFLSPIS